MTRSADYEVGKKLKHEREKQQYTQAGLGSKVGVLEKQMSRYERGENPISIITFCMIVVELMIDMAKLLPESMASEKGEVEKTLNLVKECKKFRNQELCKMASALNKSIQMGEEEGKKARKIKVAKNLLKAGISLDIILQTTGLSKDELKKHDKTEVVNFIAYKTGENMKNWRIARGYTQEELGNKVGLTGKQIQHYEQGIHIMTIGKLRIIADKLSVHAKTLLPKTSELIEKGNVEVERSDEDREGENGVLDLVREYNKIEDEEIRDKFYSLIMSVSKRIQINKEKGKKIGEIEVAN
ncbi:XRE family transcriptional regulator [Trichonephila clavata]|uniref:XRE family transcriptional regulator n=1 Tax=Trichonephila clavata TaxID=2740835 RepID=A0A8X6K6M4_TRICU|nr:XRE family transcriptional regulator [Trichonephila clavata]GFR11659.1 XRE family transcriptional regulator [Trichonephila clavata]